jgi:alkylation response protein AidB-like acyl-CoA dehydrogenase
MAAAHHEDGVAGPASGEDLARFRSAAAAWLAAHRDGAPPDYGAILPPELAAAGRRWQRLLADEGWAGLHWPTEHGGRGLTPDHTAAWIAECALAGVPPFLNMVGLVLAAGALLGHGTPQQQAALLRPTLAGEIIWCQLFSEPDAGSDLASLATRAERDGDGWVVTGRKVWCSNGRVADRGILLARTDTEAPSHRGISFFVADMHATGVECRPLRQMNGDAEFDEVFLDEVHLPGDALLGPEGAGWAVAMSALTQERGHIGASGVALRRRLDGMRAIGADADPVATQRLAELWSRGSALWAMGQRQGPVASVLASLAKLGTTELAVDVAQLRGDVEGQAAMLDGDVAHGLLSSPGMRIAGGTSEIQRNIIGERILGLPREPRPLRS